MACLDPTPGTVTAPTGSVSGTTAADLTDAFAQHDPEGIEWQWQYWVGLSNSAGAGARYRLNQYKGSEHQLLLILIGGHVIRPADPNAPDVGDSANQNPVPHPTGAYPVGQNVYTDPAPGPSIVYKASVNFLAYDSRCRQTATGTDGWSGTVTYTRADEQALEGSYDLVRGSDHVTGTFAAPRIPWADCPARPSKLACV